MSRTVKANAAHPLTRSAWYANWQRKEANRHKAQDKCRHLSQTLVRTAEATYYVCLSCEQNLGLYAVPTWQKGYGA